MDEARMPWSRMLGVLLVLGVFVIVPFVIWGDQMDASAPQLVQDRSTKWSVALIGIGLLVIDILLPVPSSVVSISLCLLLGPGLGGLAVFAGMVGAFAAGFLLGRLLPTARLRNWVGAQTWDAFSSKRLPASLLWIAASRPVPVLSEVTAILAGGLRMPIVPSFFVAALSSLLISIAYGIASWLGLLQTGSSPALLVIIAACLPALSWGTFRWLRPLILMS